MKTFRVHIPVDDLTQSVDFYSRLFAAEPARVQADYTKWMPAIPPPLPPSDPKLRFHVAVPSPPNLPSVDSFK